MVYFGIVYFGIVYFGIVYFGRVYFGIVYFGIVYFGIVIIKAWFTYNSMVYKLIIRSSWKRSFRRMQIRVATKVNLLLLQLLITVVASQRTASKSLEKAQQTYDLHSQTCN